VCKLLPTQSAKMEILHEMTTIGFAQWIQRSGGRTKHLQFTNHPRESRGETICAWSRIGVNNA
jgi:hypothetical protein